MVPVYELSFFQIEQSLELVDSMTEEQKVVY